MNTITAKLTEAGYTVTEHEGRVAVVITALSARKVTELWEVLEAAGVEGTYASPAWIVLDVAAEAQTETEAAEQVEMVSIDTLAREYDMQPYEVAAALDMGTETEVEAGFAREVLDLMTEQSAEAM